MNKNQQILQIIQVLSAFIGVNVTGRPLRVQRLIFKGGTSNVFDQVYVSHVYHPAISEEFL